MTLFQSHYGADNPASKLNPDLVREIRRLNSSKELSQGKIARKFGVSQSVVSDVCLGKTWKDVA